MGFFDLPFFFFFFLVEELEFFDFNTLTFLDFFGA